MAGRRKSQKTKTKRRRSRLRGVRRRTRRAGRRLKKFGKKRGKSIVTMVTNFIPPVASIQLLSFNQVSALPSNASVGDKVKAVVNGFTGSIFDFNIFSDVPQAHVHFDIEGAFNQWTGIAFASILGGIIGKKLGIPKASMLSSLGKKLALPAILAGSLGLKNNNPPAGTKHSPYLTSRTSSQRSFSNSVPVVTTSSNLRSSGV